MLLQRLRDAAVKSESGSGKKTVAEVKYDSQNLNGRDLEQGGNLSFKVQATISKGGRVRLDQSRIPLLHISITFSINVRKLKRSTFSSSELDQKVELIELDPGTHRHGRQANYTQDQASWTPLSSFNRQRRLSVLRRQSRILFMLKNPESILLLEQKISFNHDLTKRDLLSKFTSSRLLSQSSRCLQLRGSYAYLPLDIACIDIYCVEDSWRLDLEDN
ncbi:hypothetical protein K438DRAFT_1763994 [Mycena galopus ATCC 62051]|nr:hypothetical protein K438DRAFT_1763994 [Mycena galopus ATCC 62051]